MVTMDWLLEKYGENHQNATNKMIHWLCVPTIVFTVFGVLYALPFFTERSLLTNWGTVFYVVCLAYYARLSLPITIGMVLVCGVLLFGVDAVYNMVGKDPLALAKVMFGAFAGAWVLQFIGHKIEGQKPSFLEDVQFLMVGPAWLLHFIYKKVGIKW
jgi:uncharacterized membrane protein YGL010W